MGVFLVFQPTLPVAGSVSIAAMAGFSVRPAAIADPVSVERAGLVERVMS